MGKHFPGYQKAVEGVKKMDDGQLYEQIDCLFGRENLPTNPTHWDLLEEALFQLDFDFTDHSEDYPRNK